jgi:hypothetical protein
MDDFAPKWTNEIRPHLPMSMIAPLTQLQRVFDARLYGAAARLVDTGCVFDVRILQNGRVVTGIAGADTHANYQTVKHRVYTRYRNSADGPKIEGGCSCGERCPCVHVGPLHTSTEKKSPAAMDFQ